MSSRLMKHWINLKVILLKESNLYSILPKQIIIQQIITLEGLKLNNERIYMIPLLNDLQNCHGNGYLNVVDHQNLTTRSNSVGCVSRTGRLKIMIKLKLTILFIILIIVSGCSEFATP